MNLSDRGLRMLCSMEGFVGHVYYDQANVATIGYGHALTHDEIVAGTYYRKSLTPEEGMALCKKDVAAKAEAVSKLVTVQLTQNQFDALTDFAFNLGEGALAGSTLLRKLNAGDYVGAAAEFVRWDHVGAHEDMGLRGRREGEARLFLEGMPSVGGPTLDDVVRLAEAQQFDLTSDLGLASPESRDTMPAPPEPEPDPMREAVTRPDVALPKRDDA